MDLQPEAVVAIFGLLGLYPVWKGGQVADERKSFDLESDDIAIEAWLRAPDTPLPKLLNIESDNLRFINFAGNKVEHAEAKLSPEVEWGKSLSFENNDVLHARMRLLFAWPDDGQPLDIQLYHLETALDAYFGLKGKTTIPPALSNQLRGDAETTPKRRGRPNQVRIEGDENGKWTVRPFRCSCGGSWNERSRPGAGLSCTKRGCSRMVWADKSPAENDRINAERDAAERASKKVQVGDVTVTPESPEAAERLRALAERQRLVVEDFTRQRILAVPAVEDGKIGVRIHGTFADCPHDVMEGFVPLSEAAACINQFETDRIEQRALNALAVPHALTGAEVERLREEFVRPYAGRRRVSELTSGVAPTRFPL